MAALQVRTFRQGKAFRDELSSPISRHQERGTDSELFDRDQTSGEVCGFDNPRQLAVYLSEL